MAINEIGAAQFKEKCLALLDSVGPQGIVITKHGKPVAKLVPLYSESEELIGTLKGKLDIVGDILSTGIPWDAQP
ncbi:MAG: type II toxin-antitoxin system Phd/YefM family antitoxin [Gemmatimonadales bacterium]